ncbi:tetraacyldisaccharide 4'-kinase [Marinobacterium arenosum]|uniref:tetraacyldisaccharide 4'-kinase n=1 Tax=Marinobacterium arenosum TaxID=2862496 RepID=UPI001C952B7C|nr:tetraacyldisaccharide 4'-kinase [Marinobacterium arenosum]MBY4675265.1 tetraacyldisaccharide 4'-kinase [Marinobacterium arenosum]
MSRLQERWYSDQAPALPWRLLESFYRFVVTRRRAAAKQAWQPPVPLVVVGNITLGGTGKTPLVAWLVERARQAGFRPGIVSRGYKAKPPALPWVVEASGNPAQCGDEPLMLARRCGCPVVIDPNRVQAARHLLERFDCDLIISDDGLQHHALGRDLELVVIDGVRGLGNGHCLPAGPLREPAERLSSVDFVISNGRPKPSLERVDVQMRLQPQRYRALDGAELPLEHFSGERVHAVAGIGNPKRFFDTLASLGVSFMPHPFPDHHAYTADELQFEPPLPLLTTEKDAIKWAGLGLRQGYYLEVAAELPETFAAALLQRLTEIAQTKR